MTTDELREKIMACLEDCQGHVTGTGEYSILATLATVYLGDAIKEAAEAIVSAIEENAPPGL